MPGSSFRLPCRTAIMGATLCLLGTAAAAAGPSFDCTRASGPAESAICASPELSYVDRVLAESFARAIAALGGDGQARLRASQHDWLSLRNRCGADTECLKSAMVARVNALRAGTARNPRAQAAARPPAATAPAAPAHPAPAADVLGTWQPYSDDALGSGAMTVTAGRIAFRSGETYDIRVLRPAGRVFAITGRSDAGGVFSCGGETTAYLALNPHRGNRLAVQVMWDKGAAPPEPDPSDPFTGLPGRCILSFYER